jgi:hypothetical protein
MKTKLLFIFIFIAQISIGQIFVNSPKRNIFEFGIEPGWGGAFLNDRITFEKTHFLTVEINPYLGYYPSKKLNLSTGICGKYVFVTSDLISLPSVYSIGAYAKIIYPKTLKYRIFKKISFFSEFNYQIGNFLVNNSMPTYEMDTYLARFPDKSTSLQYSSFFINNGIVVDLGKGFNFNAYAQYMHFPLGEKKFIPRFSFSYVIKRNDPNALPEEDNRLKEDKIKKKDLPKEPNSNFLNSLVVGSSLTYIWNSNDVDYPTDQHFYEEYTWNLNVATSLNKRIMVGAQLMNLFTKGTHVPDRNYMIYGLFAQYDFLAKKETKTSMFLEMSINRGDYGTCGHLDPYRIKGLWYHGMGGGFEFPVKRISERLYVDLSFYNYFILSRIQTKYNYTQYIIGLNYRFGKNKE